jgi:hypothetical protein
MGHDKGPGLKVYLKSGAEKFEKRRTGLLKPYSQHRIVDMPQAVGIPESGLYHRRKHNSSLKLQYKTPEGELKDGD